MLYYVVPQQLGDAGVKIRIVNIVAMTSLMPPFSLASLTSSHPFPSEKYSTHIAISHRNSYFAIFKTGKVLLLSSKSIRDVEASFAWLRTFFLEFGLTLSKSYEITNIVSVARIAPRLNLLSLAFLLPRSAYEPPNDLGPHAFHRSLNAIIYHFAPSPVKPRQTALIFASGRVILTGFKSFDVLHLKAHLLSEQIAHIVEDHPQVIAKGHPRRAHPRRHRRIFAEVKS
jgi:TATA-box binding protein (TBP) (component of TFIID and TFIIIB)